MSQTNENAPTGVHFVGSVPLDSAEKVFQTLCTDLPGYILRVPDGETGKRDNWIRWQREIFASIPSVLREPISIRGTYTHKPRNQSEQEIYSFVDTNLILDTLYDKYAVESYAKFRKLRNEGVISKQTRFQVSLPTPLAVIARHIAPPFQGRLEEKYEAAMIRSVRNIQAKIPHEDLAIQWDVAFEIAMYERLPNPLFQPWFSPLEEGIRERVLRLVGAIESNVEVGLHMCYGNLGGKHFVEPRDTELMADVASSILHAIQIRGQHRINWIHLPVPKDRDDVQYFIPLEKLIPELSEHQTKLFLGLVHPDDEEGTRNRISAAKRAVKTDFGVATECGMGRFTKEQFSSVVEICARVAKSYK